MLIAKAFYLTGFIEAWRHGYEKTRKTSESKQYTNDLLNDLETMGLLFETLCVRDLRVYADANEGDVFHYRDKNDLECDAVVHLRNGSYGLI